MEVPNVGCSLENLVDMKTRPGDMHPGTALSIGVIEGGFRLETLNARNELGELRFTEFVRSGTQSLETLFALDELFRVLQVDKRSLSDSVAWRLNDGRSLEMRRDNDGDKHIRVWNQNTGASCAFDFTEENTPQLLRDALGFLHSGMCVDCLSKR